MSKGRERTSESGCARRAEQLCAGARAAVEATLRAGVESYDRVRDLPRLARISPHELVGETRETSEAILARLERALRAERNRARSGHWAYDLNRHIALRQAWLAERKHLRAIGRG